MLIKPNNFNNDSVQNIKDKISHYILLFKYKSCKDEAIPIMLFSDSKNENYEVYRDNNIIIKDMVESEHKETYRQLIFTDAPNEVQSEIKLILTSKSKAKADKDTYTVLPTVKRFSEKSFVSCLDKNFICSFYIKCVLCGIFFMRSDDFPKENFNVMVLGAGIGSVNHFMEKVFREKVNIRSVELEKKMPEIGEKYFGFKNFGKENVNWSFGDAKATVINEREINKNKFSMIVSDINNTNGLDGISPPPVFFEDEFLNAIKVKNYFCLFFFLGEYFLFYK
jgi:hypothetical protein